MPLGLIKSGCGHIIVFLLSKLHMLFPHSAFYILPLATAFSVTAIAIVIQQR